MYVLRKGVGGEVITEPTQNALGWKGPASLGAVYSEKASGSKASPNAGSGCAAFKYVLLPLTTNAEPWSWVVGVVFFFLVVGYFFSLSPVIISSDVG